MNAILARISRELDALSESAREVSLLCRSNGMFPSLTPARIEHQRQVLDAVEEQMLSIASLLAALDRAVKASSAVKPEPAPQRGST